MKHSALAIIFLIILGGCRDNRPDATEAIKQFKTLYPNVEVISATVSEDEVVARSFKFRYGYINASEIQEIELQFMESDSGKWVLMPDPTKKL